jgi:hypothetical protein
MARALMQILWPAFMAAALLELLVFAHVDPSDVRTLAGERLELSRQAVYTLSFFGFWAASAVASATSWWLRRGDHD